LAACRNLHRKELNDFERCEAVQRLAELRRKRFPEEAVVKGIVMAIEEATGEKKPEGTVKKYLSVAERLKEATKKVLRRTPKKARNVKISHLEEICKIEDEAKQAELAEKALNQGWTVHKLKREVTKMVASPPPPLPKGEFSVIYADPPWEYEQSPPRGDLEVHYPTMSLEEICDLEVPASENAVLFLWATNPKLKEARA